MFDCDSIWSVSEIARKSLGHVLFAVDEDKGVSEVALELGPRSIDLYILCIDHVIFIVLLGYLSVRAARRLLRGFKCFKLGIDMGVFTDFHYRFLIIDWLHIAYSFWSRHIFLRLHLFVTLVVYLLLIWLDFLSDFIGFQWFLFGLGFHYGIYIRLLCDSAKPCLLIIFRGWFGL